MSRKTVIVGNWKMNKTPTEAKAFMQGLNNLYAKDANLIAEGMQFGIAAPSIDLNVVEANKIPSMLIAAQNMHQKDSGAFTGELSAEMLLSIGVNAVVIGHSERREYFGVRDKDVNEKTIQALKNNLTPIVCVGETLEEREANAWKDVVSNQIKAAFAGVTSSDASKVIIAYEPIWAIGTGKTASSSQAQEVCEFIRNLVKEIYSSEVSEQIIIQYGGSVKPANVKELMEQNDIDGALVGGASLEADSFFKLLTLNK